MQPRHIQAEAGLKEKNNYGKAAKADDLPQQWTSESGEP